MEDDLADILNFGSGTDLYGDASGMNGSTAYNSSVLPWSTPVDTSGGNTNTSGSFFSSLISGLSGLGTTAAQAYSLFKNPNGTTTTTTTPTTTPTTLLPIALMGGAILVVVLLISRKS